MCRWIRPLTGSGLNTTPAAADGLKVKSVSAASLVSQAVVEVLPADSVEYALPVRNLASVNLAVQVRFRPLGTLAKIPENASDQLFPVPGPVLFVLPSEDTDSIISGFSSK